MKLSKISAAALERSQWQLLGHLLKVSKERKLNNNTHYLLLVKTVQEQWQDCIAAKPSVAAIQEVLQCLLDHTDDSTTTCDECLATLLQHSFSAGSEDEWAIDLLRCCLPLTQAARPLRDWLQAIFGNIEATAVTACFSGVQSAADLAVLKRRQADTYAVMLQQQPFQKGWRLISNFLCKGQIREEQGGAASLSSSCKLGELLNSCWSARKPDEKLCASVARLAGLCAMHSLKAFVPIQDTLLHIACEVELLGPEASQLAAAGLLDALFLHSSQLSLAEWDQATSGVQQLMASSPCHECQVCVVAGVARLLLHAPQDLAASSCTEALLAMLVKAYVNPPGLRGATPLTASALRIVHDFFKTYQEGHADELANTSVLLVCEGVERGVLIVRMDDMRLTEDPARGKEIEAIHLQCSYLVRLVSNNGLNAAAAICAAVHANLARLYPALDAESVQDWWQSSIC